MTRITRSICTNGTAKYLSPALTIKASDTATVNGKRMVKREPLPLSESTVTTPPSCLTSLCTTSIPTPRPEICDTDLAVDRPALKIYCMISSVFRLLSLAEIKPCSIAFWRTAFTLIPRPSSIKLITISPPSRSTSSVIKPVLDLPLSIRSCDFSIPWSTALRSICSSGEVIRSRILRSISPSSFRIRSSTDLPSSVAVWRTTRCRRGVIRENGTVRESINPSCKSVWVRDNCSSKFSVSRVLSSMVVLMSNKSDADSESDFDSWLSAEYWSISNGSKSLSNSCSSPICDKIWISSSVSIRRSWSARRWTVAPISSILFDRLDIPISIRERLIADSPDRLIMRSMVLAEILSISALRLVWSCSDSKLLVISGITLRSRCLTSNVSCPRLLR